MTAAHQPGHMVTGQCDYRCLNPDGARCEHPAGHEGPHRNGLLIWHDPPKLYVDGKPYEPPHADA